MNYFEKAQVYDIEIGDYVHYYEPERVIGSNTFKIIAFDKNSRGDQIVVLDKPLSYEQIDISIKTITVIHPCYLVLSEKSIRKRKLKKINGIYN